MNIAYFANPADNHDCKWINPIAEKHRAIVICPVGIPEESWLTSDSVKVYPVLPDIFPYLNPFMKYATLKKVHRILEHYKIDITHSMYAYPNAFWPYLLKFKNHMITTRGSDILIDYKTFKSPKNIKEKVVYYILRKLFIKSLQHADIITSTSAKQQKEISKLGISGQKLNLIRTGVNTDLFENAEPSFYEQKNIKAVSIFSARCMRPIYNQEIIVKAVSKLKTECNDLNITLILIDDFPGTKYSDSIRNLIEENHLDDTVEILPVQTFDQMLDNYKRCDIVVMVPKSDGTPNTAIEAMLSKRPLIIGNLDYDSELINEKTVWQLKSNTSEALANEIIKICNTEEQEISRKINTAFNTAKNEADLGMSLKRVEDLYNSMTDLKVPVYEKKSFSITR